MRGNLLGRSLLALGVMLVSASLTVPATAAATSASTVKRGNGVVRFVAPGNRSIHLAVSVSATVHRETKATTRVKGPK